MGADKMSQNKLSLRQTISGAIMESKINIETGDLGKLADCVEEAVKKYLTTLPAPEPVLNYSGHHLAQALTPPTPVPVPEPIPTSNGSEFM